MFLKTALSAILDFKNFLILVADWVGKANVHHCTKFRHNGPHGFGDIAIFRHVGFSKSSVDGGFGGPLCITKPNFIKIGQTVVEILHLTVFKMAAVRHLEFSKFKNSCRYGRS